MKSIYPILAIVTTLLFFFANVDHASGQSTENLATVWYDEGSASIYYDGLLTETGFEKVKQLASATRHPTKWLVVTSRGGEVGLSIDFGNWIHAHKINIRVFDRCLSACANYLFPAAPVKVIERGAIVAWHGSALKDPTESNEEIAALVDKTVPANDDAKERATNKAQLMNKTLVYFERLVAKQREFFQTIGVDEQLTVVGEKRPEIHEFWFLSVDAMNSYGVQNIVAPSDYQRTDTTRFLPTRIQHLELNK